MPQPPMKRLLVDTGSSTLDEGDLHNRRSAPKQRISHACDRCRSRRAKCDGRQPTCATCAAARVTCTYGTHTKKRGLPTGYVRLLELLWVLIFDSTPGAEDATLQLLRSASVVAGDAGVALLQHANGLMRDDDKLLTQDLWASSKLREAIDALVLKIDAAAGDGSENERRSRVIREGIPLPTGHCMKPWSILPCNIQISPAELCTGSMTTGNGSPASAQAELPHDAWAQIGSYLNYSYCWLPVVPKHDIVRLLSRWQDGSPCTAPEKALLWSSLAVSSSLKTVPDQSLVSVYHSAAMKELGNDKDKTSAHHVAAIVLLGLSTMELHQWKGAYLLIGQAARLAHYISDNTSQHDRTLNRVYISIFVLDTVLSSYLGLSTFLSPQHIMPALALYEADGPEDWDSGHWQTSGAGQPQCPVRVMSIFGQLARLMVVLNAALAPGDRRTSAADSLSEWLDQLPKHCAPNQRSGPPTPPLTNLDMMYWAVKAYISESLPSESHASSSSIAEYTRMFGIHASKSLLHICQKMSALSTHGFRDERDNRSASVLHNDNSTPAAVIPDLSLPSIVQTSSRATDMQHSIGNGVACMPSLLQVQSLTRSRHSPTSFVTGTALEQSYLQFGGTLGQELDDTATMQTMLEDILAQDAGNEPSLSNFMQDLGFFGEDLPSQDGSL